MSERIYRTITFRSSGIELRTAKFEGRDHLVIPVVGLVEGVIQAMNAPNPELVRAEVFSVAPSGWNGRPVFLNHPMDGKKPISGNTPEVLASSFGRVFNAKIDDVRLLMEVWIDEEKAKQLGGEQEKLLDRVRANKAIEISTGAFIVINEKKGRWNGKPYTGEWETIIPDHLAILEEGATGACSYKMGCGVRAAVAFEVKGTEIMPLFAAETKPMEQTPDRATVKKEYKKRSLMRRAAELVGLMSPDDMGDSDLREELYYALRVSLPNFRYSGDITIVYPTQNRVVYQMYEPEGICYYACSYTLAANGEATLSDDTMECERVTTYEPIGQDDQLTAAMKNVVALAGRRNSTRDQKMVQNVHDTAVTLGAACADLTAASEGTCGCGNPARSALQPASW